MANFMDGIKELQNGKINAAVEIFQQVSKSGDYHASYQLAQMFNQGVIVKKDIQAASEYFDLAFKQLNDSQDSNEKTYLLATFYLYGLGTVGKDEFKAVELLERGTKNKDANCAILLANCYRNGIGCDKNDEQAFSLISNFKDINHPIAAKVYADCLFYGNGTEVNYSQAAKYYQKAAEMGEVSSMFMLGTMYHEGKGVEIDEKKSFDYFLQAGNYNHPDALKNIAYFYSKGIAVEKDSMKEVQYLKKYADTGSADGMFIYGSTCLDSSRRLYKYVEGIEYLKNAVQLKDARATMLVGQIYEKGLYGTFKNERLAFNHYMVAYNLGLKSAAIEVLRCLKQHIGVEGNTQDKVEEFEKIVEELKSQNQA